MIAKVYEWIFGNLALKAVSLLIAIVLWIVVLGSRTVEVTKEVSLEVITGSDYVPVNELPDRISFRLAGPKAFLRAILDRKENPIRINLAGQRSGLITYRFFSDHIRVPLGVKVVSIDPPVIAIKLEEVKRREVPVRVELLGQLPDGYRLGKVEIAPKTVTLKGPENRVAFINEVYGKPVDLTGLMQTQIRDVQLEFSRTPYVTAEGPPPKLRIEIEAPNQTFKLKNIEVTLEGSRRGTVREKTVTVYVRSTKAVIDSLEPSEVKAVVPTSELAPGVRRAAPVVKLPPGVIFVKTVPNEVTVDLK